MRVIKTYKTFEEAEADEQRTARSRTPAERLILLHRLIAAWSTFPRTKHDADSTVPTLKRNRLAGKY
jgi:hypothetical protein